MRHFYSVLFVFIFSLIGFSFFIPNGTYGETEKYRVFPNQEYQERSMVYLISQDRNIIQASDDLKSKDSLNRAMATKMIFQALQKNSSEIHCFKDVKNEWFAQSICLGKKEKWISGYADGTFHPENKVSVAEASALLSRAFGLSNQSISSSTAWYKSYMESLQQKNILPQEISPSHLLTRGEWSDMLARTLYVTSFQRPYFSFSDYVDFSLGTGDKKFFVCQTSSDPFQKTYTRIQDAVDAAISSHLRDVYIFICPGKYTENIVIEYHRDQNLFFLGTEKVTLIPKNRDPIFSLLGNCEQGLGYCSGEITLDAIHIENKNSLFKAPRAFLIEALNGCNDMENCGKDLLSAVVHLKNSSIDGFQTGIFATGQAHINIENSTFSHLTEGVYQDHGAIVMKRDASKQMQPCSFSVSSGNERTLEIKNSSFMDNIGKEGSVLRMEYGNVRFTDVKLQNNVGNPLILSVCSYFDIHNLQALENSGGPLFSLDTESELSLQSSTFTKNKSLQFGVIVTGGKKVSVQDSLFQGNVTDRKSYGGVIHTSGGLSSINTCYRENRPYEVWHTAEGGRYYEFDSCQDFTCGTSTCTSSWVDTTPTFPR